MRVGSGAHPDGIRRAFRSQLLHCGMGARFDLPLSLPLSHPVECVDHGLLGDPVGLRITAISYSDLMAFTASSTSSAGTISALPATFCRSRKMGCGKMFQSATPMRRGGLPQAPTRMIQVLILHLGHPIWR